MRTTAHQTGLLRLVVAFITSFLLISVSLPTNAQNGSQDKSQSSPTPGSAGSSTEAHSKSSPQATPSPTPPSLLDVAPAKPLTKEELEKQKKEQEIPVITTDTTVVDVTVAVRDKDDRNISGLTMNDFVIYEDNVKQKISFFSNENSGVDIVVLFDITGSMGGGKIQHATSGLDVFLKTCSDEDKIALVAIAEHDKNSKNRSNLLQDFTSRMEAIRNKVTFVATKGKTPFYDAVYVVIPKLVAYNALQAKDGKPNRKMAVLIVSDGQDNASRYTFNEVKRALRESNVVIYSVVIPPSVGQDMDADAIAGRDIMEELAKISGGKAYFPDFDLSLRFPDNPSAINRRPHMSLEDIFERIARELRNQYQIAYYPTNKSTDGKFRKIKVKVTAKGYPRLTVRTKEGYYPPKA